MSRIVLVATIVAALFGWTKRGALAASVRYDVSFDATWSAATHPGAYPGGAHFSPLWIASHDENINFWEPGGIASDGIQQMAETGETSLLTAQYNGAIGSGVVLDRDLGNGITSPGRTGGLIVVDADHRLVTVVTMVAPSPDWFVGVDSLNLWDTDRWLESVSVDIHAYDAGTDSGASFQSPNADTNPREPIALLGSPFTDTPLLGTLAFTRVYPPLGDTNGDGIVNIDDLNNVRGNWGALGRPGVSPLGDTFPFDGVVDIDDLNAVRNNFGRAVAAVPEPSSGVLAMLVSVIGVALHRSRRRDCPLQFQRAIDEPLVRLSRSLVK